MFATTLSLTALSPALTPTTIPTLPTTTVPSPLDIYEHLTESFSPYHLSVEQIYTGTVLRRKDRKAKGLFIKFAHDHLDFPLESSLAYLPTSSLAGRNHSERKARFASLVNAVGSKIEVAIVGGGVVGIRRRAVSCFMVSETQAFALRDKAARMNTAFAKSMVAACSRSPGR